MGSADRHPIASTACRGYSRWRSPPTSSCRERHSPSTASGRSPQPMTTTAPTACCFVRSASSSPGGTPRRFRRCVRRRRCSTSTTPASPCATEWAAWRSPAACGTRSPASAYCAARPRRPGSAGSLVVLDSLLWIIGLCLCERGRLRSAAAAMEQVRQLREAIGYSAEHVENAGYLGWVGGAGARADHHRVCRRDRRGGLRWGRGGRARWGSRRSTSPRAATPRPPNVSSRWSPDDSSR